MSDYLEAVRTLGETLEEWAYRPSSCYWYRDQAGKDSLDRKARELFDPFAEPEPSPTRVAYAVFMLKTVAQTEIAADPSLLAAHHPLILACAPFDGTAIEMPVTAIEALIRELRYQIEVDR